MKSTICPYRRHCLDSGACETCDHGIAYEKLSKKVGKLKRENELLKNKIDYLNTLVDVLKNPNF